MIPGVGGADPRQVAQMMKRFGIDVKDLPSVQEVIIRTPEKDYVFADAKVSVMKAQGTETWQISGKPKVVEHEVRLVISDDDVKLVAKETGKGEADARTALEATGGDIAEAIVRLT